MSVITAQIEDKSFGAKRLFDAAEISLEKGEKVGLIGRNGEGKSTLFAILSGEDTDFRGEVAISRGITVLTTAQEHLAQDTIRVQEYIEKALPRYQELHTIITTYPDTMGDDITKIEKYSDALEEYGRRGYYDIESTIERILTGFQLADMQHRPFSELSGGQKRLVEVAKIMVAQPDLCLIDEPTNHMDYNAKQRFVSWLNETASTVLVITHDRDVLDNVSRIVELKDKRLISYKGDYAAYLKQNMASTSNQMNSYEVMQRRITNLTAKVTEYQRFKERARDPGTIQRFKRLENQAREELETLKEAEKPTFWVDQESAGSMKLKTSQQYAKHKAKNIRLNGVDKDNLSYGRMLIDVSHLSLGYNEPLFSDISFRVQEGQMVEIRGRNGAGKSTLVRSLIAAIQDTEPHATQFAGEIDVRSALRLGVYEQETPSELLSETLSSAIEKIYLARDISISETKIRQLMSDYLFSPGDVETPVMRLSGGQKARLQLISMLANNPQLLILDEPTNHLDLPSIEELEQALHRFSGATIYVSHDSYFRQAMGGDTISIEG